MFGTNYNRPVNQPPDLFGLIAGKLKWVLIAAIGIPLLLIIKPFTIISAGHTGVVITLGSVSEETLSEGFHFINPIAKVKDVSVRVEKAELKNSNSSTHDLQLAHSDIVANYRLDAKRVAYVYKNFGLDFESKILLPAMNEAFKATVSQYTSTELITKRSEVSNAVHEALQDKVEKYGLTINEISLTNFGFGPEFEKAVEQKVVAVQRQQTAEADLARIKIEAEQNIAQAKGEAEAIRIQSQAIQSQGGKDYVALKAIEKWDGELPKTMTGNAIPFINIAK